MTWLQVGALGVLLLIGLSLVTVLAVTKATEAGLEKRMREIKAMFADALAHGRSFDSTVDALRRERRTDSEMLTDLLQWRATVTEKLIGQEQVNHRVHERIQALEARPISAPHRTAAQTRGDGG